MGKKITIVLQREFEFTFLSLTLWILYIYTLVSFHIIDFVKSMNLLFLFDMYEQENEWSITVENSL